MRLNRCFRYVIIHSAILLSLDSAQIPRIYQCQQFEMSTMSHIELFRVFIQKKKSNVFRVFCTISKKKNTNCQAVKHYISTFFATPLLHLPPSCWQAKKFPSLAMCADQLGFSVEGNGQLN